MMLVGNLFYLLVLLLPTQLGRHFFFDFAFIEGLRSDYLAPTIFLSDIIVILLLALYFFKTTRKRKFIFKKTHFSSSGLIFLVAVGFLLLSSAVASNKLAALYKLVKIIELIFLGFITIRIKPAFKMIVLMLSFATFYSSLIAVIQFIKGGSVGGLFWFLGERSFYVSTPGIATFSLFGIELLRPYSVFPHPNVLGGFLAIVLPILIDTLLYKKEKTSKFFQIVLISAIVLGLVTIALTFSRAAWLVLILGLVLLYLAKYTDWMLFVRRKINIVIIGFYLLIILSLITPLTLGKNYLALSNNVIERRELISASLLMLASRPFLGYGLNNSIIHQGDYISDKSGLFIFQPVHNMYLLIAVELGIVGFFAFLIFLNQVLFKSMTKPLVFLAFVQILLLGMFDHYLLTLQQGQLLFTLIASLAFLPQNT